MPRDHLTPKIALYQQPKQTAYADCRLSAMLTDVNFDLGCAQED